MPVEMDMSADISSGAFLKQPGTYHLFCIDSEEVAQDKDGKPLDGFRICCEAVAGTTPGFEKKQFDLVVFHPNASHKDGGAFSLKIRTRALVALGKIHPNETGQRKVIDLTPETTKGCQFIATLKEKDGHLKLDGANIYHVDDPEAGPFPKNERMLGYLRPDQRLTPKDFGVEDSGKPANGTSNGHANGNGNGSTAPERKSNVNLDDI